MFHFDLSLEDTGHGVELTGVAIGAVVGAAHGVIAALAHLLALTHSLLVLHHARGPEGALHAQAGAGCTQVCRGDRRERHWSQSTASPAPPGHCAQQCMPASPASGPRLPPPSRGKRTELLASAPAQPLHPPCHPDMPGSASSPCSAEVRDGKQAQDLLPARHERDSCLVSSVPSPSQLRSALRGRPEVGSAPWVSAPNPHVWVSPAAHGQQQEQASCAEGGQHGLRLLAAGRGAGTSFPGPAWKVGCEWGRAGGSRKPSLAWVLVPPGYSLHRHAVPGTSCQTLSSQKVHRGIAPFTEAHILGIALSPEQLILIFPVAIPRKTWLKRTPAFDFTAQPVPLLSPAAQLLSLPLASWCWKGQGAAVRQDRDPVSSLQPSPRASGSRSRALRLPGDRVMRHSVGCRLRGSSPLYSQTGAA